MNSNSSAMNSFDSFLEAMGESKVEELTPQANPFEGDNLGVAKDYGTEDNTESTFLEDMFSEDEESNFEDTFEEDAADAAAAEQEDEHSSTEEGDEFTVMDYSATFKLPNGMTVSGMDLKNISEFQTKHDELQQTKQKYHEREQLLIENADIGMNAINAVEAELLNASKFRALTAEEKAQMSIVHAVKNKFQHFEHNIKQTYNNDIQQRNAQNAQLMDNNVNKLFEVYPSFEKEVPVLKQYLSSKGYKDGDAFLKSVSYDPAIISMLMDASVGMRAKSKIIQTKGTNVKGIKGKSNVKEVNAPDWVSSYDKASYEMFSKAMGDF